MSDAIKVHKFQAAGLGLAPFKCIGVYQDVGPHVSEVNGCRVEVGSPGQPMGTCDYCGTGIADCYVIQSADGKEFRVGSSCVAKTNDSRLIEVVDQKTAELRRQKAEIRRRAKFAKDSARVAAAVALFEANLATFEALPHPRGFTDRATGKALTMADQIRWMLKNAGMSGRVDTAIRIEGILEPKG